MVARSVGLMRDENTAAWLVDIFDTAASTRTWVTSKRIVDVHYAERMNHGLIGDFVGLPSCHFLTATS